MPALSFSCEVKKEALVNKRCSQTVRPVRKNPIEEGDKLYIYWKQRVSPEKKDVHKIGEGVVTEVFEVTFRLTDQIVYPEFENFTLREENEIAKKDGFDKALHMFMWFYDRYGEDIDGQTFKVIRWDWKDASN